MRGASPGAKLHADSHAFAVPFSAGAALCLVGAPLGMARGAFDSFAAATGGKLRGLRAEQAAEKGALFARISAAGAAIDASVALILADCAFVDGLGKPADMTPTDRARLRRNLAYAVGRCRDAVNSLFEGAGGGAIYDSEPLQRVWRDLNAASAHVAFSWDDAVNDFAKARLDLPPSAFARVQSARSVCTRTTRTYLGTANSPSAGGVTACSLGFASCGIQSYGSRYARYTSFDCRGPANNGFMYSQTIALSRVTSNMRPPAPSVTKVLPFGKRCALLMFVLKNRGARTTTRARGCGIDL